jgi:hypothetical protein
MDALSISPVAPATLSALRALPPVQAAQAQPAQAGNPPGPAALSPQNLAQTLFQQTLQATSLFPVAEPAAGSAALIQGATASLLAALAPAQAPVPPAPDATSNPAALPTSSPDSSTAPPSALPAPNVQDLPATQDPSEASLSPDFAMQTALRFGAGVVAQATTGALAADLSTGLVRDATTVLRLENLQPRAGGPGPEAFAQPGTPAQRILRTYEAGSTQSATQGAPAVDLLA